MTGALAAISPNSTLTESNIEAVIKDIRVGLLEADVALSVIDGFLLKVKSRAIGTKISRELSASQEFLKIVKEELTDLMGGDPQSGLSVSTTCSCFSGWFAGSWKDYNRW